MLVFTWDVGKPYLIRTDCMMHFYKCTINGNIDVLLLTCVSVEVKAVKDEGRDEGMNRAAWHAGVVT